MRRSRKYSKYGIDLIIQPTVFHPGFFLSTNILLEFILQLDISGKKILELGAGSGFISFYLGRYKNVKVTASDINEKALAGLKYNSKATNIALEVVQSNLFDNLSPLDFDFILINPPYYAKQPTNRTENAFYCGENFEYYLDLFTQLDRKADLEKNQTYMILSEDCEIEKIKLIAIQYKIQLVHTHSVKKLGEWNTIFKIINFA